MDAVVITNILALKFDGYLAWCFFVCLVGWFFLVSTLFGLCFLVHKDHALSCWILVRPCKTIKVGLISPILQMNKVKERGEAICLRA